MEKYKIFSVAVIIMINCSSPRQNEPQHSNIPDKPDFSHALWDLEELYSTPTYRIIDSTENVWSIIYDGPVFKDTLREVFAYYSNPSILKNGKNDETKYPGIVLAHGGGGRAFKEWVEKWAAEGYAAIAFDMSARDGVEFFNKPAGPDDNHRTKFHEIKNGNNQLWPVFAIGAAIRAHSFLLSREEVITEKTAITGISWGGYVTCIAAALDNRFKVAVPVYGCGFFEEMEPPSKEFAQMDVEDVESWQQYFDPKQYIPHIHFPVLFINGNKDFFFSIGSLAKSYQSMDSSFANILINPDMKHSHHDGWEPFEIKAFIDNILFEEFPLPNIHNFEFKEDKIKAKYQSPVMARKATLWYTDDLESSNHQRVWYNKTGKVTRDSLYFDMPKDSLKMGFIHLVDHRNLKISSELFYENGILATQKHHKDSRF